MRVVVQRAKNASCSVNNQEISKINNGFMLLVGFTKGDDKAKLDWMCHKVLNLRIFEDENGLMNKSLKDVDGEILCISQFTLYGNAKKGNRPSFVDAMKPDEAIIFYDEFCEKLNQVIRTEKGVFGADMDISFTNVGPTTILLEK